MDYDLDEDVDFNVTTFEEFNETAIVMTPYSERPETYVVPIVFAIIFLVGVLGNGTLVLIFIRHRTMRNVPNTYILSLALGDLLVIISCVPFTSIVYTLPSWPYGEFICKLSESIKDISIGVSVFTLTALSADRHRTMRNVPNTYILSLALGDLLVIISCVPFTSIVYTLPSWPYGEFICKLSESIKDISIGVSVFTLTALSADRFFAIVDPMRKLYSSIGGRGATGCTIMIASAIWLLAIACATPAAVFSYIRVFSIGSEQFEVCYPYPEEWGDTYARSMVMVKFLVYYAIPLTIIGCFYILMARHLVLSTRNMPGELQGQARQVRARKKVAKTVLAFVLVFAICFLPHHICMLWFYYYPYAQQEYNKFWHVFRIVGFCLSFINSCVNPIALYCVSGTFRKHFDRYLLWCKRRDNGNGDGRYAGRKWDSTTLAPLHHSTTTRRIDGVHECTVLTTFINGTSAQQQQPQI